MTQKENKLPSSLGQDVSSGDVGWLLLGMGDRAAGFKTYTMLIKHIFRNCSVKKTV